MNLNKGFTSRYYMKQIDPGTWRDVLTFEITGGTISRSDGDLMEAADIDATDTPGNDAWVRIYLDARQEDGGMHEALFTGLMSAPEDKWDGRRNSHHAECYSVLKPAADILMPLGWYAPAGTDGARLAAKLIAVGPAPVMYEDGSPALASHIVAEGGESNLTMAKKILQAIGWRIRITGMGEIHICPEATEPSQSFDSLDNDCVEMTVTDSRDWFNCPNVFRAVSGDLVAIAKDEDPESPLSTVSRGREIWMEESSCSLNANETIAAYAKRRLKEEQMPARHLSYSRRYKRDFYIGDLARIHYPAQGIDGVFKITSQNIRLGHGASTSEEAEYYGS